VLVGWNKKTLVGTIGYHNLSNHSIAPMLIEQIRALEWAANVEIEEMNWGPIAIVQWFESLKVPFERVVLFTATERPGRNIADMTIFRWGGGLPGDRMVQACVGDAATGVISPVSLLIIGEYFKIWPEEVYIADVEPGPERPGPELTPEVKQKVPDYFRILGEVCQDGYPCNHFLYGDKILES
jgi:hypothetical protein